MGNSLLRIGKGVNAIAGEPAMPYDHYTKTDALGNVIFIT